MIYENQVSDHEGAWCLHCARFSANEHIHFDKDGVGNRCPFDDCDGGAFDLYWWGQFNAAPPSPPIHGKEYPQYPK